MMENREIKSAAYNLCRLNGCANGPVSEDFPCEDCPFCNEKEEKSTNIKILGETESTLLKQREG